MTSTVRISEVECETVRKDKAQSGRARLETHSVPVRLSRLARPALARIQRVYERANCHIELSAV